MKNTIHESGESCGTILDLLRGQLGISQTDFFCAWLKVASEALRAEEPRPGQALMPEELARAFDTSSLE